MKIDINDIRAKCNWEGKEPENHSIGFDYCRKLIEEGFDPKEKLDIYRGDNLSYSITSLEEGSKWKIRENSKVGPKIVKYIPNDYFLNASAASPMKVTDALKKKKGS